MRATMRTTMRYDARSADRPPTAPLDAPQLTLATSLHALSLSYTSSFGEYNPGGGKDAVEK